jgi:hypothetical protein
VKEKEENITLKRKNIKRCNFEKERRGRYLTSVKKRKKNIKRRKIKRLNIEKRLRKKMKKIRSFNTEKHNV